MKILFKFTTRSRRALFLRGIDSIVKNLNNTKDYHILISVENELHDSSMHPLPQLTCNHTYKINLNAPTTKIDAINRDVNEFDYDWDILVNMSDDMVFTKKGFDEELRSLFMWFEKENVLVDGKVVEHNLYRKNLDRMLHYPDGNRNDLVTMSIMGRDYYKRFNYIYHPDYKSLWCDNEATEVAKILGCYKFVNSDILAHLHPAYGKGKFDTQYQQTESYTHVDEQTYYKRKAINFGL